MLGPLILLAVLALLFWYSCISDAYDTARWKTDHGYCRYGASMGEVVRWWWRKRF